MVLVELAAILVAAKVIGDLATRVGQPPVLGQLVAGLLLGLIAYATGALPQLAETNDTLDQIAQLGVILLMFLAGLETDWEQMRATGKAAFTSAAFGVALPLIVGWGVSWALGLPVIESLFVGVILTATSVSITAQTLLELGSLQTTEGATILGAAVIDDVIGLIVFSLAIAATSSTHASLFGLAAAVIVFFVACFAVGSRLIPRLVRWAEALRPSEAPLAVALAIAFVLAFAAQAVGIAAITGAYMAGLLLNRHEAFGDLTEKVKVLAYGLFIPVFLVKTGMDAHIEDLGKIATFVAVMSVVAVITKIAGCGLGARLTGLTVWQSVVVGVGMIGRGEVALIVASLGRSAGVVSQSVFAATVVVVLVTTLVTPPLLGLALTRLPGAGKREALASSAP